MKIIKCKECDEVRKKYNRNGSLFCNRKCYMNWKRKNPNKKPYKGRVFVSNYWYLYKPEHPKAIKGGLYIAEHRFILEKKIGRVLEDYEVAHHINGNTSDNKPENLELLTISEHNKQHAKTRKRKPNGQF